MTIFAPDERLPSSATLGGHISWLDREYSNTEWSSPPLVCLPSQIISFRKSLGRSDGWGLESRELSTSREHFRTEQKRVGGGGNLSPAQLAENTREQKKRVGGRRESVPSSTLTPLIHLSMRDLLPWNRKGQTISSSLLLLNRLSVEFLHC